MFTSKLSRRNFMQQSALWAAAFAAGGTLGLRSAMADRAKELNILCWEGYNSAQVLDPFRQSTRRHRQGGIAHQRSDHDQPAARRRNQRLGSDQRQQSLGAQGHVPREADQAARPRQLRALFREDAAGLQAALQMGDGRRRQASCSAWPSASAPTASSSTPTRSAAPPPRTRAGTCGTMPPTTRNTASWNPTTGTSSTSAASRASIRSASTPTRRWRNSPRPPSACSRAPRWSATSPP